jgi:hypothetical protein
MEYIVPLIGAAVAVSNSTTWVIYRKKFIKPRKSGKMSK